MQKQQALIDFTGYKEDEIGPVAHKIVTDMTANLPLFPSIKVPLATVTTQIGAYEGILNRPDYPGRTGDLGTARTALDTSLRSNGIAVNTDANGLLSTLEKSGYPIS